MQILFKSGKSGQQGGVGESLVVKERETQIDAVAYVGESSVDKLVVNRHIRVQARAEGRASARDQA